VLGIDRSFTELCLFDILASDNRTVEEALASYNESLLSETDEGPSSAAEVLVSPAIRQIVQATASQVCPGQPACTGQGTCSNSVCICNTGTFLHTFLGLHCSNGGYNYLESSYATTVHYKVKVAINCF